MAEGNDGEDVSLGTKVSPEFKQSVRVAAAQQGMSMSQYVREAVEARLEREEADEGNRIAAVPTAD